MSYRDPEGAEIPSTAPVGPDDLPGSEDDAEAEDYVPFEDEAGAPDTPDSDQEDDPPPTPGAYAAPPPE